MLPSLQTTRKIFKSLLANAKVPVEVAYSFAEDDNLTEPFSIMTFNDTLAVNWDSDACGLYNETCYYNGF